MMTELEYNDGSNSISNYTAGETRTNLIINYLPQNLSDQEFYKIFVVVGPIKNCRIMKDLNTYYSFGFGFVEYQKPEDAAKAILQLNNLAVQHKRIKVSYARPPGEEIKETNLYIQNIPRSYTIEQLEDLFTPFGQIVQRNLLQDKVTGLPRGVGFVRYDKKSEADLAMEQMNGVLPQGGCEPLVVKIAEEHGKMKAAYYAGYHAGLQNHGRGRGRGNFNGRGGGQGYGRGSYNNVRGGGGGGAPSFNGGGGIGNGGGGRNAGNGVGNGNGGGHHYPLSNGGGSGGGFFGGGFNNPGFSGGYSTSYPGLGGPGYNRY